MGFGENIVIILFSSNKFFEEFLPLCNDVVGYWYSFLLRGKLTIHVDFSQMLSEKSLDQALMSGYILFSENIIYLQVAYCQISFHIEYYSSERYV